MGYLSWVGLHHPERPITITPIYLCPGDGVGSSLRQGLEGGLESWGIAFTCVRLWEQDAAAAVDSGMVGLAVLNPLMAGATGALVERAAALVLEQGALAAERATVERQQHDLEQSLTRIVEEAVIARFPATSVVLVSVVRWVRGTVRLEQLLRAVLDVPDQAGVEQLLRDVAESAR